MLESRVPIAAWLQAKRTEDRSTEDKLNKQGDEYFLNDEEENDEQVLQDFNAIEIPLERSRNKNSRPGNTEHDSNLLNESSVEESVEELPCLKEIDSVSSSTSHDSQHREPLEQHQSILFTLPYEVRVQIWTSVVGGGLVHITELRNMLGHVACMDRSGQKWGMWQHDCWYCSLVVHGIYVAPESYGKPEDRWLKPGSLGLLRSCQRLYADAINVFYDQNTFGMRSLGTLHLFLNSLTLERLDHVTSLYLSPNIHPDYKAWERTWVTLSRVPNLKTLRVELRGKLKEREPWARAKLLQSMCCVEQTENYEVKVPWELEETRDWIWGCPFTLEGTYGEVIESGEKEYLALLRRQRVNVRDWFRPGQKNLRNYVLKSQTYARECVIRMHNTE